ncbi:MAG: siderophore-interacting protein [Propionibacteriaceae bacterium]
MAQRNFVTHPLVLRRLEVDRVVDVTPRMRRVTLVGDQLGAFHADGLDLPAFTSPMFDDHVKLIFAEGGDLNSALPIQRARSIDWPAAEHRRGRDYTPRRFDPDTGELDLDFVLHGAGPAVEWARTAEPGVAVHFAGPKSSLVLPDDLDWIVLAADETGLPAVGRFLDERPLAVPVDVIIEIGDPRAVQELVVRPEDTLHWVSSGGLEQALRDLDRRDGSGYAWAAGESKALLPIRRWLRGERQLPASHVNVTGYWHHEEDEQQSTPVGPDAETLLSPMPWFATRAAVELGVLAALAAGPRSLADIVRAADVDPARLRPVLDYLATIDVLALADDQWRLGPVGQELLDDDHLTEELFGTGAEASALAALSTLPRAVREGGSPWQHHRGHSVRAEAVDDPDLCADLIEETGAFDFVAPGVLDLPAWLGAASVLLTGPGAGSLVRANEQADDPVACAFHGESVEVGVLTAEHPSVARHPGGRADLAVSARSLGHRTDEEVADHLGDLRTVTDRVLLIDVLSWTGPGTVQYAPERALATFARTGVPTRTAADIAALVGKAGWRVVGQVSLGWDHECFELRPLGQN